MRFAGLHLKLARGRLKTLGEGIHGDVRDGNLPAEEERAAVGVDEVAERFALSRKPRTPRGIGRAARETARRRVRTPGAALAVVAKRAAV